MAKSPEAALQKTRREALELFRLKARPALEAVLGLVEHLESVEALDQAAREAESRREAADRDLAERKEHNRKLREEAAGLIDQARADAGAIVAAARADVDRIMDDARVSAGAIRASAQNDARLTIEGAERKRDDLLADASKAQEAVDAARSEIATLTAQRDELNAQIEAARAVVGKLMGG